MAGKRMLIKDFAKNISALNDDDLSKKRNTFHCDLGRIMGIFIRKGCFSEHDFRTAERVFFGICNLNLITEQEIKR
jgi:hypothetical protein